MRSALFWDITRSGVVIVDWRPIFKGQEVQEKKDGMDKFPRNVGKGLPHDAA